MTVTAPDVALVRARDRRVPAPLSASTTDRTCLRRLPIDRGVHQKDAAQHCPHVQTTARLAPFV